MDSNKAAQKGKPSVITKVFKLIKSFTDIKPEWGVRDLANHLDMPSSSVHRLLLQLKDEEIIEFDENSSKYKLGFEFIRIASKVSSNTDINKVAEPFMKELSKKYDETICLVLLDKNRNEMMFAKKVDSSQSIQYIIQIGVLQPLPYGASGKSMMAFLPEEDIEQILSTEDFSTKEISEIKKELKDIKRDFSSSTQNERTEGSKGIASPIFDYTGMPIGSLLFTIPISRFNPEIETEVAADIRKTAHEMSTILGYTQ